jgi:hypothetical protein
VTLIAIYNSEGCVGRCDAQCYDAKHLDCDCVCGGANHGKGEAQAMANTIAHGRRWAREFGVRAGTEVRAEVAGVAVDQMEITWD